jgi:DMSO/TMAO reductase YedYZ molybdopterin-dependent catalytic subunit
MTHLRPRRWLLKSGPLAAAALVLPGCTRFTQADSTRAVLRAGEGLTMRIQRLLMTERTLAREFTSAQISARFPTNGTVLPSGDLYKRLVDSRFAEWRLTVDGLVQDRLSLSLNQLKDLPPRTQITQHQCDEGWTAIGEWTGVPVGRLLQMARPTEAARYVVFHCLDAIRSLGGQHYYESLDLFDAFHPQTILAYGMNGGDLPIEHGAPVRLRAELHIGYKNAKYIDRLEVVDSLAGIGRGHGSVWADQGYQWFAGM